jgi:hypothetical protein
LIQLRLPLLVVSLLSGIFAPVPAQTSGNGNVTYAPVPFGPGERMTYKVAIGALGNRGTSVMEIQDIDTIHGAPTYQLRMNIKGGIPFAHLDNTYQSWFDMERLISRRYRQDTNELGKPRKRHYEFDLDAKRWRRADLPPTHKSATGVMPTDQPLDDLSFLYYARTMPLVVGETYELPRYFKEDGNPVIIKVLRRQVIPLNSGQYATIVVQPIIKTDGLFSEGGKAEVYFTDDDRRIPVLIKAGVSSVPLLKTLKMELTRYEPGTRVAPPFKAGESTKQ